MEIGMTANWVMMSETAPLTRRISLGCGRGKVEMPWVRVKDLSLEACPEHPLSIRVGTVMLFCAGKS
jgi:hypothetical protein